MRCDWLRMVVISCKQLYHYDEFYGIFMLSSWSHHEREGSEPFARKDKIWFLSFLLYFPLPFISFIFLYNIHQFIPFWRLVVNTNIFAPSQVWTREDQIYFERYSIYMGDYDYTKTTHYSA